MKKFLLTVVCVAGVVACNRVSADSITYELKVASTSDGELAGYPGPYGTVTVDLTSPTTATITFASLTAGGNIYLFGDGRSVDVNVNAASFSVSAISGSNAGTGFTPGPPYGVTTGFADGFGYYNLAITSRDGFYSSQDLLTFVLTDLSGTWASPTSVLTRNASGYLAAAHIYVTEDPAVWAVENLKAQGYAAAVPDGGMTAALLGLGMLGLGFFARRKA